MMSAFLKIGIVICLSVLLLSLVEAKGQWKELPRPTDKLLYKMSFLDSSRGWVVGFKGAILKTTNGGATWETQTSGVSTDIQEVFMLSDRYGWGLTIDQYVDTLTWYGTRILRTTNGGTSWTNQQYPVSGEFFNSIVFQDSLRGWMGGEFGHIVRTTNGGATWIPVQIDESIYGRWGIVKLKFLTPLYGFAMGGRMDIVGVVWRTTDGGLRWSPDGICPEPVRDIHMLDSLNLIGIVGDVDYGASVVKTRDGGGHWDYTFLNIFGLPSGISFRTRTEAWGALGFAGLLMYTTDTATTWITVETPRRRPIYDLAFTDSSTGYAVGDSGMILKYNTTIVGVQEHSLGIPGPNRLRQNFPNPFNPSTSVAYDLSHENFVTMKVFNMLGQEVQTLVNSRKEAGHHLVNFDAGGLPSGVYLYRLSIGSFVDVKKMLLIR